MILENNYNITIFSFIELYFSISVKNTIKLIFTYDNYKNIFLNNI
jgi:hypothetical protein